MKHSPLFRKNLFKKSTKSLRKNFPSTFPSKNVPLYPPISPVPLFNFPLFFHFPLFLRCSYTIFSSFKSSTTQRRSRLQHGYCIGVSRRSSQATHSFIHSDHFCSAPSSPLPIRGAHDYSTDPVS